MVHVVGGVVKNLKELLEKKTITQLSLPLEATKDGNKF